MHNAQEHSSVPGEISRTKKVKQISTYRECTLYLADIIMYNLANFFGNTNNLFIDVNKGTIFYSWNQELLHITDIDWLTERCANYALYSSMKAKVRIKNNCI